MSRIILRPHLTARSTWDLNRTMLAGLVILAEIALLPILTWAAASAFTDAPILRWYAGMAVFLLISSAATLTVVERLEIDAEGIHFRRRIGNSRVLPWDQVVRVRPAPPGEVILRGWIWPPVPPREATRSFTAEGHYCIESRKGRAYFPPAEEDRLREAIQQWAPHVLAAERAA
jgi:hypothetical protein